MRERTVKSWRSASCFWADENKKRCDRPQGCGNYWQRTILAHDELINTKLRRLLTQLCCLGNWFLIYCSKKSHFACNNFCVWCKNCMMMGKGECKHESKRLSHKFESASDQIGHAKTNSSNRRAPIRKSVRAFIFLYLYAAPGNISIFRYLFNRTKKNDTKSIVWLLYIWCAGVSIKRWPRQHPTKEGSFKKGKALHQ